MAWPKITDTWLALREFLGAFINDRKQNAEGKIFYNHITGRNQEDLFLESYGKLYRAKERRKVRLRLKGITKEMIWQEIVEFEYPYLWEGENINKRFTSDTIISWAVKNNFMDDEMVALFKGLVMQNFNIIYSEKGHYVGLQVRDKALDIDISLDELLDREIEQWYYNKIIGDKSRKWWYTHMLRRNVEITLQSWQKKILYNWKQFNMIAWSRRIGKTFTSAFVAYRELYKIWGWYGARERQILYACVSEDKMWQPLQYLKLLMRKDIEHWYIKVSGKEFTNTITNAKLIFVTAWSKSWARSYWADLVIIDEAAEIPDSYWLDLLPIIMQEKASVFAISTINEDSQDGWFYRELLKWELTWDEDYNTIRVTIDDNELLDEKAKQATKDKIFEASQMKYWTELYCIFPNSKSVFKLWWVIQPPEIHVEQKRAIVIWYDPWKINDDAWIIVTDMNNLRTIEEIALKNYQYKDQWTVLKELREKYQWCVVVMDRTWVWEAVFEIVVPYIDISIKYKKSWWDISYNQTHNYYNVPKKELVETIQIYMESSWLKVDSTLEQLIIQMKWFKKFQAWAYVQYWWVWVKDDLVNGLLLCWFYMKHIKGIDKKNQVQVHNDVSKFLDKLDWQNIFDDYTDSSTFSKYIY